MLLILPVGPYFIQSPSDVNILVGERMTLICNATGHPAPSIYWTFEGKTITNNTIISVENIYRPPTISESVLTIESVEFSNRGQYVCVASNEGESAVSSVSGNVTVVG